MEPDPKERIDHLVDEWMKRIALMPSLEEKLSQLHEADDPCLICMESISIIASITNVLKDSLETIAEQISEGNADLHGMCFMMDLYNKWLEIVLASVIKISGAAHKELEYNEIDRAQLCFREMFTLTQLLN
jgi:hypothetical protein